MLVEPEDLAPDTVLDIVRDEWLPAWSRRRTCRGAPARTTGWAVASTSRAGFVTADHVGGACRRLEELLDTYAAARDLQDGATTWCAAVAPRSEPTGVGVVRGTYLLTVTPYLEGAPGPGEYADEQQRA